MLIVRCKVTPIQNKLSKFCSHTYKAQYRLNYEVLKLFDCPLHESSVQQRAKEKVTSPVTFLYMGSSGENFT